MQQFEIRALARRGLELPFEIIRPLQSLSDSSLKGILLQKGSWKGICHEISPFIGETMLHISKKKSRWAEARKSCRKVFQIQAKQSMMKPLLETLESEAHAAGESLFEEQFLASMRGWMVMSHLVLYIIRAVSTSTKIGGAMSSKTTVDWFYFKQQ